MLYEMPALLPTLLLDIDTDDVIEAAAHIGVVLALALLAIALLRHLIGPFLRVTVREQMEGEPEAEVTRRIDTLSTVIYGTITVVILTVAVVTILPEFGVNAGPLIAGLGLVGLAVGFGAQYLVRDMINGVEILTENHYARGDFVQVRTITGGNVSGNVEDINLRRTVLRDRDGIVHFVSHGVIEVASNHTRGFSRINVSVVVGQTSDIEKVFEVIDSVGQRLAEDSVYGPKLKEAPKAIGVDRLAASSLEVRVEGVAEPGEQWAVSGELRRRLKLAFDAAGIRFSDA
jgi:small conductance mechanosensitive channel